MSADSSSPLSKLQQGLVECFRRGTRLASEKDYDYAHTMFAECVIHDQANVVYVEALLQNLRAKFPRPKQKLLSLGRGGSRELKQAVDHQAWSKVLRLGIDLLKTDPWDIATLRALAQACARLRCNEAELAYLKQALSANPKDLEVNRHCARSLERMGQFDQAIACWHRIETIRSSDREATEMIIRLSEERLKYPGGRPTAVAQPTKAPTTAAASMVEDQVQESIELELSPRQKLEQAISNDPYDVSNYLKLADLLAESDQFQTAEATLLRGMGVCGEHGALKDQLRDIQRLRSQLESEVAEARRKEIERKNRPFPMPWLEIGLVLAGCGLLLQLFPPVAAATWKAIDFRHWSQTSWFAVNIIALLVLVALQIRPKLRERRRKQQKRLVVKQATRKSG